MDNSSMQTSLKLEIYNILLGKIIPSLRAILLRWDDENQKAKIEIYQHGEITATIRNYYEFIRGWLKVKKWSDSCVLEIIRRDAPLDIPSDEVFIIYLRKEPFLDPIQVDE